jgi:pyruvate,water dikinase
MTVLTPTWHEEPERVLALVHSYLAVTEAPTEVRARLRQARDQQVAELGAACEDETAVVEFQRQLAYARKSMVGLENHNHLIEQVAGGQLRLAIMAAARWLVSQGALNDVNDVFWLKFAEIEAALREESPSPQPSPLIGGGSGWGTRHLQDIIGERQAEWRQWAELVPPPILGIPEATLPPRPPFVDEVNVGEDEGKNGRLTGLGASPGVAEGRACVVIKGEPLPELEAGAILVAQNAGPLWTPYFPQLGGLVLEEGSLGQHAAATAREYGIPAVIRCRQATRLIANGDWIKLDGATGSVAIRP